MSHKNDPHTSYLAAEKLAENGKWYSQKKEVYDVLKRCNGSTSAEVGRQMGVDPYNRFIAARRLPELEKAGLVIKGPDRQCAVTGSVCVTWFLTEVNNGSNNQRNQRGSDGAFEQRGMAGAR